MNVTKYEHIVEKMKLDFTQLFTLDQVEFWDQNRARRFENNKSRYCLFYKKIV